MTARQEEQQLQTRPAPPPPWRIDADGALTRSPWARRDWMLLGLFAVAAIAICWPIVPVHRMVSEMHSGDGAMFAYILSWGANTWWRHPLNYLNLPAFHPLTSAMTGTDGLVLPAICLTDVWLVARNPTLLYNLAIHMSAWFTLCSFYLVVRAITPLPRSAVAAGAVLMTVNADRYWHSGGHANLIWTGAMPLGFLAGWLVATRPKATSVLLSSVIGLLSLLCSWYFLVLSGFSALAGVAAGWIALKRRPSLASLACIGGALVGAVILISPIALTYLHAQQRAGVTRGGLAESENYSATVRGWLQPPDETDRLATPMGRLLAPHLGKPPGGEDSQFAGYVLLALVAGEFLRLLGRAWRRGFRALDRLSALSLLAALAAFLLSLGPYVGSNYHHGPYYLLHWLVLRHSSFFRCPARFAFLFQLFTAVSGAIFLAALADRSRKASRVAAVVVTALVCAEHWPVVTAPRFAAPSAEAISRIGELTTDAREPFVVLPDPGNCWPGLCTSPFGRPMLNGWANAPHVPGYDTQMTVIGAFPSLRALAHIDKAGARWIVSLDPSMTEKAAADPQLEVCFRGKGSDLLRIRDPGTPLRKWEARRIEITKQLAAHRRDENREGATFVLADFVHDAKPWCWPYQCEIKHRPGQGIVLVPQGRSMSCLGVVPRAAVNTWSVDILEVDFRANRDLGECYVRLYWMAKDAICRDGHARNGEIRKGIHPGEYSAMIVLSNHPTWFDFGKVNAIRLDFMQLLPVPGTELVIGEIRARTLPQTSSVPF